MVVLSPSERKLESTIDAFFCIVRRKNLVVILEFLRDFVDDPNTCGCDSHSRLLDDFCNLIHERHREINRKIYEAIPNELFPSLQERLVRKQRARQPLMTSEKAKGLLENFLQEHPMKATWI